MGERFFSYSFYVGFNTRTLILAALATLLCRISWAQDPDTINVSAFQLPRYSDYLSPETHAGIKRLEALQTKALEICNPSTKSTGEEIRVCEARMYPLLISEARKTYKVQISPRTIAGIYTEVVTPSDGVAAENEHRVLINVHGGAFMYGARFGGQLEAMPVAAIGKFKVIAIDYRMGPENHFPAASVDIAAVYAELLKEYPASNIGIYGCSAGGRIIGQTIAWMSKQKMQRPGAIGILCSPPTRFGGDSNIVAAALAGRSPLVRKSEGYFKGFVPGDPILFPGDSDQILAQFPPTLLITSTRDYSLSPMVQMHSRLVRLGVDTSLHVFEGLGHGEFLNWYIPEAKQTAQIISRFFDTHLPTTLSAKLHR